MMTEKLVVLDRDVQGVTIHIYDISSSIEVDNVLLEELGHDPDYCTWEYFTKADVVIHKKLIK